MWSWVTTLRKCFGKKAGATPPPPEVERSEQSSLDILALKNLTEETLTAHKPPVSLPARENQPFLNGVETAGFLNVDQGVPPPQDTEVGSLSGASLTSTAEEQKLSLTAFNPDVLLDNLHTPLARVTGEGYTPLLKHAHRSEDQKLKLHNTPFELRVERQLDQPQGIVFGRNCNPSTPNIPVHEATSLIRESELLPAKQASVKDEASLGFPASKSFPANKENSDHGYGRYTALKAVVTPKDGLVPPATPVNQLHRPGYMADSTGGSLQTPAMSMTPLFVLDANDVWGKPHVVGLLNPVTKYGEDKHLRMHDTPFDLRVEREMEKERIWTEQHIPSRV